MSDHPQDFEKLLSSPQAMALLARMRQLGPQILQNAAQLAANGQPEQAKLLLSPLLQEEQTRKLIEEMRDLHGGF